MPASRSFSTVRRQVALAVAVGALLLAIAACSAAAPATNPTASEAWVRPPMGVDLPAAGYLTIVGGSTADALLGASADGFGSVEVHETMAGHDGMTGMQPVERIEVAAGATVRLEPGGYHLMLMGPSEPIEPGDTVRLHLRFEIAGEVVVEAEVRSS